MRYILDIDETGKPKLKGFNEDLAVQMAAELELVNKMIGAEGNEKPSEALVKVNERMTKLRNEIKDLRAQVTSLRADAHNWESLNHARGREMREVFGFNSSMKYEEFLEKLTVLGKAYKDAKKKREEAEHIFQPYMTARPLARPVMLWGN